MTHGRKRLVTVLSGATLAAAMLLPGSSPTWAEPSIDDVQTRVDRLYHEAEQASERYNDLQLELKDLRHDLTALRADEQRQHARLARVQDQVQDSIIRQYQGEGLATVGEVVVSDDPSTFLSQLSAMSAYNDLQASLYGDYLTELKALDIRRDATTRRADQVAGAEKQAAAAKATVDRDLSEAQDLLAKLKEEERQALLSRGAGTTRLPSDVPASGRAAAAVRYALAQVGDAYVYGAAGPSAFDCSGLTMMAWAQAGVGLPHSSSAQFGSGPHVSSGDLRPGDLVFYYSPISHVGIYIGNGLIVHAANPGAGVRVAGVFSMPYSGAVRPG
ncbi:MAG TPA: NlpC/P60 family protein [Nocardioides sp.]|uniref:C40 family peptidase n=1 Tax=Nocardioides sp. TaxID=35761 RepID=UPI002C37EDC8|nr:NlpC/P60 family protein [Nocardioides sp.]HQR27372.1 NlpC/P60 family protein [Nocardioides sp.]